MVGPVVTPVSQMWKLRYLKVKFIVLTPKRIIKDYIAISLIERKQRGLIKNNLR